MYYRLENKNGFFKDEESEELCGFQKIKTKKRQFLKAL